MPKEFRIFPTHMEIHPYKKGEYPGLEKMCSTAFDLTTHSRKPIGFVIEDDTLFVPRGVSINYITNVTNALPTMYNKFTLPEPRKMSEQYLIKSKPWSEEQKDAINFLLSRGEFEKGQAYSQLVLNMDTGLGKTYATIVACIVMKVRTLVIVHRDTIEDQWLSTLREKTTVNMDRVCTIRGGDKIRQLMKQKELDYDFFFTTHQTLTAYVRMHGGYALKEFIDHLHCGIKVVDEAHLCFKSIVYVDMFSNIPKNFYLTATFGRGDVKEIALFKRVFANAVKLVRMKEKRDIIYHVVTFNSNPSVQEQEGVLTGHGFNAHLYADYAFDRDPNFSILYVFFQILEQALTYEGKTLVVIPKISYCEYVTSLIQREYPDKIVGAVHSKKTVKENLQTKKEAEIIVSTIGSLGTGTDIAEIRNLIIMEPFSSVVNGKQLIGRLRQYKQEDSHVFELIDKGFKDIPRMYERREKMIRSVCKKIETIEM